MHPLFLIRYDTECTETEAMRGFLPKLVEVHRTHRIPATFFCTGTMLDGRADEFREFWTEVRDDPLFDLQDHSYSHIGIGYESGSSIETLRDDYQRSFDAHERVFGKRPTGVSICGTGGRDGKHLAGFDTTEKSRAELDMLGNLGVRFINCFLDGRRGDREFCNYTSLGHPDIMGFPSGFADCSWMIEKTPDHDWQRKEPFGPAKQVVLDAISERGRDGIHMPLMLHDWCVWKLGPDKELDLVRTFADAARNAGFELVTHAACYDRKELWCD